MNNSPAPILTLSDVMLDLEAGRSLPLRQTDRLADLTSLPRPALGGPAFLRTYATARVAGRLHPRLARPALEELWFTPWVHPSALRPMTDVPVGFQPWGLHVGGRELRGYTVGSGPTVVLVHGWASRGADLRHVAVRLVDAGWRVVAPDLPAHGRTAGRRTDLFELGRALHAVLDRERPEAVVVHSMGFPTLTIAIEQGAEVPPSIVALAPGRRMAHALQAFGRRARLGPHLVAELRRALEARFGPDVWEALDVDRIVPLLDSRGLVIHDSQDDEVPLRDAEAIVAGWRGARLVTTEGLGHRHLLRDDAVLTKVAAALA